MSDWPSEDEFRRMEEALMPTAPGVRRGESTVITLDGRGGITITDGVFRNGLLVEGAKNASFDHCTVGHRSLYSLARRAVWWLRGIVRWPR